MHVFNKKLRDWRLFFLPFSISLFYFGKIFWNGNSFFAHFLFKLIMRKICFHSFCQKKTVFCWMLINLIFCLLQLHYEFDKIWISWITFKCAQKESKKKSGIDIWCSHVNILEPPTHHFIFPWRENFPEIAINIFMKNFF